MARITVEDCLDHVDNRFELVMKASKRARQLATGGKEPMVKEESDKATVIALREIAEGLVTESVLQNHFEEEETYEFTTATETVSEEDIAAAGLVEAILENGAAEEQDSAEGSDATPAVDDPEED